MKSPGNTVLHGDEMLVQDRLEHKQSMPSQNPEKVLLGRSSAVSLERAPDCRDGVGFAPEARLQRELHVHQVKLMVLPSTQRQA